MLRQALALTGSLTLKAFVCDYTLLHGNHSWECESASLHLDVQCVEFHWLLLNAILCRNVCVLGEVQENGMPRYSGLNVMARETKLKQ